MNIENLEMVVDVAIPPLETNTRPKLWEGSPFWRNLPSSSFRTNHARTPSRHVFGQVEYEQSLELSIIYLYRGNESLAGELKRRQVGNSDNISGSWGVEDDVKRVKQTVVGENLILLLEVIGTVQKLDLSIELTRISVKEDLDLLHGGIKVDGMDGSTLNVSALVLAEEVGALSNHGRTGVRSGSIEGEVSGAGVVDIHGSRLVTRANQGLDGTHHTVLGVGLDLHGSPVGSDP